MRPKLLITGASGFVGYHLVRVAKDAGLEIHAAVRRSSRVEDISAFVDKFVYPDFSDIDSLTALFSAESYDYIIHAAAMTKAKREDDMCHVNIDYTLHIAQAAFSIPTPPKKIHFVSSLAAIGPIGYDSAVLINEATGYNPVTAYGRSKRRAEEALKEQFADKPIRIFRPTAVYGPNEKDIFILLKTLYSGVDTYIGRKPQRLSFIYVADLAQLLVDSLRIDCDGLQCYNITDGRVYGRYELANIFKKVANKRLWRIHVPHSVVKQVAKLSQWLYKYSTKTPVLYPERLNELTAENWGCDISKAKEELGFVPQYDLEAGLTESLQWYRAHGWL